MSPAVSKKQRKATAIAKHNPSILFKRNSNLLSMSKSQLHDFAKTKEKGLPVKKKKMTERSDRSVKSVRSEKKESMTAFIKRRNKETKR